MLEKAAASVRKVFGKGSLMEDAYARAATWTSLCLVVLATPLTLAYLAGDPAYCWVSKEWSQEYYFKFVSSYCYWAGHLYSHPLEVPMPHQVNGEGRMDELSRRMKE